MPFYPFFGEGSPAKIDYREKIGYHLILTSPLEDLDIFSLVPFSPGWRLLDLSEVRSWV